MDNTKSPPDPDFSDKAFESTEIQEDNKSIKQDLTTLKNRSSGGHSNHEPPIDRLSREELQRAVGWISALNFYVEDRDFADHQAKHAGSLRNFEKGPRRGRPAAVVRGEEKRGGGRGRYPARSLTCIMLIEYASSSTPADNG